MRIYFVNIDSENRTIPNKAIEYSIGANDWFRLASGRSYFIASEDTPGELYDKLRRVLHEDDTFTVAELKYEGGFAAYMAQSAWEWVEKYFPNVKLTPKD